MSKAGLGQTLIDVAVERSGRASEAWELARVMGVSLTELVECDEVGDTPLAMNKRVAMRYRQSGTRPATELTEGIGGWKIGEFKVS